MDKRHSIPSLEGSFLCANIPSPLSAYLWALELCDSYNDYPQLEQIIPYIVVYKLIQTLKSEQGVSKSHSLIHFMLAITEHSIANQIVPCSLRIKYANIIIIPF